MIFLKLLLNTAAIAGGALATTAATLHAASRLVTQKNWKSGDICLITGAASGFGREMALLFAKEGCTLVLWDLNMEGLENTRELITQSCSTQVPSIFCFSVNVADYQEVKSCAIQVEGEVGTVSILVNNAGIVSGKDFHELTPEDVERTMKVNLLAHFWTTMAFLPGMKAKGKGSLVYIASSAGLYGVPRLVDYTTSKAGNIAFAESLARELRQSKFHIQVFLVCPYYLSTGMFEGVVSPFPLLPILPPRVIAEKVVTAVTNRKDRLVLLVSPRFINTIHLLKVFPYWMTDFIADLLGISSTMRDFVQTRPKL